MRREGVKIDQNLAFRSVNEVKDGESEAKISSVSGANRKRKWTEEEGEEEEQKAEESSDLDTSSDDDDDVQADEKEANQLMEPVCLSQEKKPEEMKEEEKTEKGRQNEERNTDQGKIQTSQHQKPSKPVVFVPVDRLPEIQVCAHVKVAKHNETKKTSLFPGCSNSCLPFGIILYVDVGGSAEAACAGRGAGHHGGSSRKSLHRHLRRNRKWKDNPSASVSV